MAPEQAWEGLGGTAHALGAGYRVPGAPVLALLH